MTARIDRARVILAARGVDVFAHLPEQVTIELLQAGQLMDFEQGQVLIKQGDPSDSALVLIDGSADVLVESLYGSVPLASLTAPAIVGEIGVFTNVSRTATVRARTSGQAIRLARDELERIGHENPRFLAAMLSQLGHRLETFNRAIGVYAHALSALERGEFELKLLDDLRNPLPEFVDFSQSFRHLAEQIVLRQAQREEMANAGAIQQAMLPTNEILKDCREYVDVQAHMRAARDVGGDLYDFFVIDPDRVAIMIGDVCGKGIPAALFMAMTQIVMRSTLRQELDVGAAATAGNALLAANNREMMYTTLICAVLELRTGVLRYCSCGHPAPFIMRKRGGVEIAKFALNRPLGLGGALKIRADSIVLEPGDRIFLYTDGFVDAVNQSDDQFGDDRLLQTVENLRALPSQELLQSLVRTVDEFAGEAPQFDDLTAVLIAFTAKKAS